MFAKLSKNTAALMWWATLIGTVSYGVWLMTNGGIFLSSSSLLPFMVSAVCETGYFATLVRGYSQGGLSLVYPISRGSAPIFAALWGAVLLEERLPLSGYVGVAFMVAGVYIASRPTQPLLKNNLPARSIRVNATAWALASGIFISIYSVSDKLAVVATPPLIYNWWVFAGNTILWIPIVWRRRNIQANLGELRKNLRNIIPVSVMMMATYGAALTALSLTSASYVVAGRGLSVIVGAFFGVGLLKERFGFTRIVGAILMTAGLVLVAFG